MHSTQGSFRVAAFRGIPIRIHYTLILVLPLLAILFGGAFRRAALLAEIPPERLGGPSWLWGLGVAVGLFAAVLIHEMAHVLYALRSGGQVRSITLMMVGGVSELSEAPRRPRDEALMALAGPLTSMGLAGLLYGVLLLLQGTRSFNLQFALFYLASLNLILGLFNLVPAFPLDGGRVLRALLAGRMGMARATRVAAWLGRVFAAVFAVVALLTFNLFLLVIAFFVLVGAEAEARQVMMRTVLQELRVAELMTPRVRGVEAAASLEEALAELQRERRLALPVLEGERPVGWVTLDDVQSVPAEARGARAVRELVRPAVVVAPGDDAWTAVRRLSDAQPSLLLVEEDGQLVGTLDGHDVGQGLVLYRAAAQERADRRLRWRQERPA